MDGFTGFKTAAAEELPDAIPVTGPFHVVRLAADALDACRRRVQPSMADAAAQVIRCTRHAEPCTPEPTCSPPASRATSRHCSPTTLTSRSKRPGGSTKR